MVHENTRARHEGGGSVRRFRTLMVAAFLSAAALALAWDLAWNLAWDLAREGDVVRLSLTDAGQVRSHHATTEAFYIRPINARAEDPSAVTLQVGGDSRFTLERPFETVLIGNPNMVDVQTQDERSVLLKPLSPGATNLVFIDTQGLVIINLTVFIREAGSI